jgi:ABC-2 type transport system permease protein
MMHSKKLGSFLLLANGIAFVVLLNLLSSTWFFRWDLTEEKRFTIKEPTRALLSELEEDVYIEVYLEGDLNPSFSRLQKAIRETLEEFRLYSNNHIRYSFVDPATAMSSQAQNEYMQELMSKGIIPTDVVDQRDGGTVTKRIFPGALVSLGGFETGVMLLKGNKARTPDEEINQSIEGIEYELSNAIYKLANTDRKRIGFVSGHGELDSLTNASLNNALLELYDVYKVNLLRSDLKNYSALIVAKPRQAFTEVEKYKLDQYIVSGGRVLLLLDRLEASMDSVSSQEYYAFPYNLNLDDMLFRYGVRINMDLIQDASAGLYPVVTGNFGSKPQMKLMDWPFYPLINRYADHPVTRNLDAVLMKFVSTIDTVKADGIRKTPLLFTSQYSRHVVAPVPVSLREVTKDRKPENYAESFLPVAYLLEGKFTSVFRNRFLPEGQDAKAFREQGEASKIIVFADGDLARNEVNPKTGRPLELGLDPFTQYTFANQELLLNAVAYLTDENGLIKARNKEVKIRPLDKTRIREERVMWQVINLVAPLVVLILYGLLRAYLRRAKYAKH